LLLAAFKPSGGMHVFLGDFTGHGLPAAIGAMPLAEVFYGMTAKGYSMAEILREMNAKLKRILPVGVFCCATLLNVSFHRRVVEVWNGGLPDGYLYRAASGERVPLISRHLPLGVRDAATFDDRYEIYPLELGDRLFLLSDGVLEGCNSTGQLFGEERLLGVFAQNHPADRLFAEIQLAISEFCGAAQDDVSMVEVTLVAEDALPRPALAISNCGQFSPLDWSASFEFRAQTLRHFNPLPFLLQQLLEVQELRSQAGALYTVLAELYSNALEHGVLGLDSQLKRDAQGFSRYYRERSELLASLDQGFVRFHLQLTPEIGGGRLTLRVEDSGAGFNPAAVTAPQSGGVVLCGRGMALVRQLSDSCSYSVDGRSVSVDFVWTQAT
jgi:hypothetical protein